MNDDTTSELRRFFAALADERSLRIAGHLVGRDATIPELARLLDMRPPVVARLMATLADAGLVRATEHDAMASWTIDIGSLRDQRKRLLALPRPTSPADEPGAPDWERSVLTNFFDGDRLKEIPANRRKREVVLTWLVGRFEYDTRYHERDINEIIKKHHPDFASLRRELIDNGYMQRENGIYWRVAQENSAGMPPL